MVLSSSWSGREIFDLQTRVQAPLGLQTIHMQIKIIVNTNYSTLEADVNSFLSTLTATIIQVQYFSVMKQYTVSTGTIMEYSVCISYQ